jgi:pimeloyl-ACP methyl ester carboxylesterase
LSGPELFCHPGGPGFDGSELGDLGGLDATRTLVLIDPRGTKSPADSYALDDYVADLEELRGDRDTIDLLGFSHGGLVAAAYAIAHPERVRKLVLASALAAITPEMQTEAERVIASKAGEPWHAAAVEALAREEAADFETPEEMAAMWNAMAPVYFSRWDERYRQLVEVERLPVQPLKDFNATPFDLRPELGRIQADTLAITGTDDFICGPAAARVFADGIPRCEVVLLADAGHFTFLEQPEAFRTAVEAFLSR